jgi:hypothetical protein
MAVTQQLARVSPDLFDECRRYTGTLERLLAFELVGPDSYLDLDWASRGLVALAHACNEQHGLTVGRALEGDIAPLNAGLPAGTVEIPPAGLDTEGVRRTAAQLMSIEASILLAGWPRVSAAVERSAGRIDDPVSYYRDRFQRLQAFYAAAAQDGEATIMWWD